MKTYTIVGIYNDRALYRGYTGYVRATTPQEAAKKAPSYLTILCVFLGEQEDLLV